MGILVATSGKMIQNGIGKVTYYVYDTVNIFMYILYTVLYSLSVRVALSLWWEFAKLYLFQGVL